MDKARDASPVNRARMLTWAAMLGCVEGRTGEAAAQAREARELARAAGDQWGLALCEAILGLAVGLRGEVREAGELLEAGRARFGRSATTGAWR